MPGPTKSWTKLAKSTKARALIQLCFYSELVAAIQGKVPERMHVVLGRGAQPEEFSVQRYLAYFRKIKREFQAALAARPITYPEPVEHCSVCDWFLHCYERRHADDHLTLVAGITRNQRKELVASGVKTVVELAQLRVVGKEVRTEGRVGEVAGLGRRYCMARRGGHGVPPLRSCCAFACRRVSRS